MANMGALMLSKHVTHGLSRSPTHKSWGAMMQRCTNEKHPAHVRYAGRGIAVCQRWTDSFAAFVEDMGIRPAGMTLDRIDNSKGYEPGNCKWSTRTEQARNRRSSRLNAAMVVEIRRRCAAGETQASVGESLGLGQGTISKVVLRTRWADVP